MLAAAAPKTHFVAQHLRIRTCSAYRDWHIYLTGGHITLLHPSWIGQAKEIRKRWPHSIHWILWRQLRTLEVKRRMDYYERPLRKLLHVKYCQITRGFLWSEWILPVLLQWSLAHLFLTSLLCSFTNATSYSLHCACICICAYIHFHLERDLRFSWFYFMNMWEPGSLLVIWKKKS